MLPFPTGDGRRQLNVCPYCFRLPGCVPWGREGKGCSLHQVRKSHIVRLAHRERREIREREQVHAAPTPHPQIPGIALENERTASLPSLE